MVSDNGSDRQTVKAEFAYADDLAFEVYERTNTSSSYEQTRTGSADPAGGALYVTFDRTAELVYEYQRYNTNDIYDIYDVDFSRDDLEDTIRSLLPVQARARINNAWVYTDLEWTTVTLTEGPADGTAASVWTAAGKFKLPDYVRIAQGASADVSIKIHVKAEDHVAVPRASLPSGSFLAEQSTTLESDTPGAVIMYTTDGSDPLENGNVYTDTESIDLSSDTEGAATGDDGKITVTLRTIAVKDEAVVIPEDKEVKAVSASDSSASQADSGEATYTTEDQIITAVIAPANLETLNTVMELEKDSFGYTGSEIKPDVHFVRLLGEGSVSDDYEPGDDDIIQELAKGTDYEVTYQNNIEVNEDAEEKAKAVVTGKGNFTGTVTAEFEIYGVYGPTPSELILDKDHLKLAVNSSEKLQTNTTAKLNWSSDNETVATVDGDGKVTAHKYGKAKITVSVPGTQLIATCDVQTLFSDVAGSPDKNDPDYQYFYTPVYWAAEYKPNAITRGYDLEYFGVGKDCERQDFALFLYRLAKQPAPDAAVLANLDKTFTDVKDLSTTFRKAIAWAYGKGIVKGYTSGPNKGKYGVKLPITRREAMIMLWRYAGKPAPSAGGLKSARGFTDVKGKYAESSDSFKAIAWAAGKGIANGYTSAGSLPPGSGLTVPCYGCDLSCLREQMITFLHRYAK